MADAKGEYSEISKYYVEELVPNSEVAKVQYNNSKNREAKYNENWKKQSVNINEIVDKFAPGSRGEKHGVKVEFRGKDYIVKADMAAGYLRIYDKKNKCYVKLDGTKGNNRNSHYKILRREEM